MQRSIAERSDHTAQAENTSVRMQSISLGFVYEHESFSVVHEALEKLWGGDRSSRKAVNHIRERESSLDAAGWSSIGALIPQQSNEKWGHAIKIDGLPNEVKYVHFAHYQVLPSLACIECTAFLSDTATELLMDAANAHHLPRVKTHSLSPKRFLKGHTISYGESERVVAKHLDTLTRHIAGAIRSALSIKKDVFKLACVHPWFEFRAAELENGLLVALQKHDTWLRKFGYETSSHSVFSSELMVLARRRDVVDKPPVLDEAIFVGVIAQAPDYDMQCSDAMRGVITVSAIRGHLALLRSSLELVRAGSVSALYQNKTILTKFGDTLRTAKSTVASLRRLKKEFALNRPWILSSIGDVAGLKRTNPLGGSFSLKDVIQNGLSREIDHLMDSAQLLDATLSDRLDLESTYVMYQLQRGVFWLRVLAAVAAIAGAAAAWERISESIATLSTRLFNSF